MGREKFVKRQKELARQKKRVEKAAKRQERKEDRGRSASGPDGEDPDIAGIQPGPQPKAY
jgi:hypothetical protein